MDNEIKSKKSPLIIVIAAVALIAVAVIIVLIVQLNSPERKLKKQLELGDKYLSELDYENAIIAYKHALDIDPKCTEAYLGLADAYIGLGRYDDAEMILEKGYDMTQDARIANRLEELRSMMGTSASENGTDEDDQDSGDDSSSEEYRYGLMEDDTDDEEDSQDDQDAGEDDEEIPQIDDMDEEVDPSEGINVDNSYYILEKLVEEDGWYYDGFNDVYKDYMDANGNFIGMGRVSLCFDEVCLDFWIGDMNGVGHGYESNECSVQEVLDEILKYSKDYEAGRL